MKHVLIFYSHFAPAFKAGGPVQSLVNLVNALKEDYSFFVFCSARDMGETKLLDGIVPNTWNDFDTGIRVFYANGAVLKKIRFVFRDCNPDFVYINGMYLPSYNWLPLCFAKAQGRKVIMAPRGMLQKGALTVKPLKKKIFLLLFKWLGLHKGITWHATDMQEIVDTKDVFGQSADVMLAPDIPRVPQAAVANRAKNSGELQMVYLSLITEKKNLHLALDALKLIKTPVEFDIYGPVKDWAYWKSCQQKMNNQIHTIRYQGAVNPMEVQDVLSKYHLLILPTKGENFGHAIFEALSAGTPVLTSPFTPWGTLQQFNAGITTDLDVGSVARAIKDFIQYDEQQFSQMSVDAHALAMDYFYRNAFKKEYRKLFS